MSFFGWSWEFEDNHWDQGANVSARNWMFEEKESNFWTSNFQGNSGAQFQGWDLKGDQRKGVKVIPAGNWGFEKRAKLSTSFFEGRVAKWKE